MSEKSLFYDSESIDIYSDGYLNETIRNYFPLYQDENFLNKNLSYLYLNDYSMGQVEPNDFSLNQLRTPLFYILFIVFIYIVLVTVVFLSALYSTRKKSSMYDLEDEADVYFCYTNSQRNESDKMETVLLFEESSSDDDEEEKRELSLFSNFQKYLRSFKPYKPIELESIYEHTI
ncbi:unnamed protein product [Brachionus calyciflorus]|uniref:Uncharacterized protein n=1 Tax=Brachionus calyciflorus TaxID=104777 RepID=A0A814CY36_9BILA|nr:unnamed protein product [Brachionus calyciflorus]